MEAPSLLLFISKTAADAVASCRPSTCLTRRHVAAPCWSSRKRFLYDYWNTWGVCVCVCVCADILIVTVNSVVTASSCYRQLALLWSSLPVRYQTICFIVCLETFIIYRLWALMHRLFILQVCVCVCVCVWRGRGQVVRWIQLTCTDRI